MATRREFLGAVAGLSGAFALQGPQDDGLVRGADNSVMDQGAGRTVRLPPKTGATPSMTADERDALERRIHCQCGCTLDVFTCRTTDFACQVSPAMHRDVMALVAGGYTAQEIIDAFERSYGERVLMAPKKVGFNLVGYAMPFAVLLAGGTVLTLLLRSWHRRAQVRAAASPPAAPFAAPRVDDATAEERARLEAAVRGDDA